MRVEDRDEPGRAVAEPRRPAVGEPVTVRLTDLDLDPDLGPDLGNAADPAVRWERWRSPGTWQAIPEASGSIYTLTPADAGRHLRAVVSYADRHGPGRRAVAALAHAVLGPMLTALDARADSGRTQGEDAGLRPAFDPRIRHYGLPCAERDVMTVSFAAPPGVRVSVNSIQPRTDMTPSGPKGAAAAAVTPVNPETGAESFRIPAEGGKPLRALPVSPLAVARAPGPLDAVLPDLPRAGHGGTGDRVAIAVAFSRPPAAFGPETGSVAVEGGELVAVAPLAGFGRPAHAWRLDLAPAGDGPLTLRFRAGIACAGEVTGPSPGICTADGARLRGIPRALTIPRTRSESLPRTRSGTLPRLAGGTAASDRTADAGDKE